MIRHIEITSTDAPEISGIAKQTGKPYSFRKQTAYLHREGNTYPDRAEITLDNGQMPYQPGMYELHPDSIYVDRNGRLAIKPVLVRVSTDQNKPVKAAS